MKYILTQPNKRGRIGHQFHNWAAGLCLSKISDAEFIHSPFHGAAQKWEKILNFSKIFKEQAKINKLRTVELPRLDLGHKPKEIKKNIALKNIEIWKGAINKEKGDVVFYLPTDAFGGYLYQYLPYFQQQIQECYWSNNKKYEFAGNKINIGIHIRRGDVSAKQYPHRWIGIADYKKTLESLRLKFITKKIKFHIFSERPCQINELRHEDVEIHLDGSDIEAFRKMCSVDILVTGLSTFSVLAAYINKSKIFYNDFLNFTQWDSFDKFHNIKTILEKKS
jgi:hypothetical protein